MVHIKKKNSLKKIFFKTIQILVIISFSCLTRSKQNLVGFIHFPFSFSQSFNPPDKLVHEWGYFPEGNIILPYCIPTWGQLPGMLSGHLRETIHN